MPSYQPLPAQFSLQLESLRGLSAVLVLFSHCFQAFIAPIDVSLYPLIRLLGQSAVMMFFVLSGFLIGHSVQKNSMLHHGFNLRHFIKQRCKRILPPFYFAIGLMCLLYLIAPLVFVTASHHIQGSGLQLRHEYAISTTELWGSLFFVNGFLTDTVSANAPLWSLSYEVWFYLIAACLMLSHTPAYRYIAVLIAIGLGLLNSQFLAYLMVWLLAFRCAFFTVHELSPQLLQQSKGITVLLAICVMAWDHYQFFILDNCLIYRANTFTLFNGLMGVALCCWLMQLRFNLRAFTPIATQSANYAYSLYISHFPIVVFILGCLPSELLQQPILASLSLLLSMALCLVLAWGWAKFLEPQRRPLTTS